MTLVLVVGVLGRNAVQFAKEKKSGLETVLTIVLDHTNKLKSAGGFVQVLKCCMLYEYRKKMLFILYIYYTGQNGAGKNFSLEKGEDEI